MVDVAFRTGFLLLYAAAWLLVFAVVLAAKLLWVLARLCWTYLPAAIGRARETRRDRGAGQHALASGVLSVR